LEDNIILDKSFKFAIRVVKLYKYLCDDKREYVLSKQLLRCGTSIGANINEAQARQSKADFISKMAIASKKVYLIKLPFFESLLKLVKPSFHKRLYGSLEVDNTITKEKLKLTNPYGVEEGIKLMIEGENP
jgi:hypothetical protein